MGRELGVSNGLGVSNPLSVTVSRYGIHIHLRRAFHDTSDVPAGEPDV